MADSPKKWPIPLKKSGQFHEINQRNEQLEMATFGHPSGTCCFAAYPHMLPKFTLKLQYSFASIIHIPQIQERLPHLPDLVFLPLKITKSGDFEMADFFCCFRGIGHFFGQSARPFQNFGI